MENREKTVVITGASSGAGRAIALAFAEKKKGKLVLAARNITELAQLATECENFGATVKTVVTDTSNYHDMINLAASADDFGSGVDVWINNAGVLAIGEFDQTPMEINEQVVKTNLLGYMNGAHAVLPYFKKQGKGVLINNISIGGFLPVPYGVGYSASKFGLRGFSAALKAEMSDFPEIHVCDAFPAFLDTPGIQHAANYTGKQLKPAPPVYDPNRLAMAIVNLADHPKPSMMMGSISILLRLSHGLFPSFTRAVAGKVIKTYLHQADPINTTSGNIFNPVAFGNTVYGGWGIPGKPKAHRKYIVGGLLAFSAISLLLLRKS